MKIKLFQTFLVTWAYTWRVFVYFCLFILLMVLVFPAFVGVGNYFLVKIVWWNNLILGLEGPILYLYDFVMAIPNCGSSKKIAFVVSKELMMTLPFCVVAFWNVSKREFGKLSLPEIINGRWISFWWSYYWRHLVFIFPLLAAGVYTSCYFLYESFNYTYSSEMITAVEGAYDLAITFVVDFFVFHYLLKKWTRVEIESVDTMIEHDSEIPPPLPPEILEQAETMSKVDSE